MELKKQLARTFPQPPVIKHAVMTVINTRTRAKRNEREFARVTTRGISYLSRKRDKYLHYIVILLQHCRRGGWLSSDDKGVALRAITKRYEAASLERAICAEFAFELSATQSSIALSS